MKTNMVISAGRYVNLKVKSNSVGLYINIPTRVYLDMDSVASYKVEPYRNNQKIVGYIIDLIMNGENIRIFLNQKFYDIFLYVVNNNTTEITLKKHKLSKIGKVVATCITLSVLFLLIIAPTTAEQEVKEMFVDAGASDELAIYATKALGKCLPLENVKNIISIPDNQQLLDERGYIDEVDTYKVEATDFYETLYIFTLYDNVHTIEYAGENVYLNGVAQEIEPYKMPRSEYNMYIDMTEDLITSTLALPDSLYFSSDWSIDRTSANTVICSSYVEYYTTTGYKKKSNFTVEYVDEVPVSINIDGTEYID